MQQLLVLLRKLFVIPLNFMRPLFHKCMKWRWRTRLCNTFQGENKWQFFKRINEFHRCSIRTIWWFCFRVSVQLRNYWKFFIHTWETENIGIFLTKGIEFIIALISIQLFIDFSVYYSDYKLQKVALKSNSREIMSKRLTMKQNYWL